MSRNQLIVAGLLVLTFLSSSVRSLEPIDATRLRTFGSSGKKEKVLTGGREAELFSHQGRGCLTHMWFGGSWPGFGRTRIRVYVDGETTASIDMELFLGHGVGSRGKAAPWGTTRMGKTGHPSGIYNTFHIPFGQSVRVTAQLAPGVTEDPDFWWIIRGVENLPVEIGGIRLPESARLKLYRVENKNLAPLETVDLLETDQAGLLYLVTMQVKSRNLNFLEAVLRAYLDDSDQPLLLSSGTEDYFLGTYYFNRGLYQLPEAGVTELDPFHHVFTAYRFHEQDPIVFQNGLRLVWRNGEARPDGTPYGKPLASTLTCYAWTYEWDK